MISSHQIGVSASNFLFFSIFSHSPSPGDQVPCGRTCSVRLQAKAGVINDPGQNIVWAITISFRCFQFGRIYHPRLSCTKSMPCTAKLACHARPHIQHYLRLPQRRRTILLILPCLSFVPFTLVTLGSLLFVWTRQNREAIINLLMTISTLDDSSILVKLLA